MQPRASLSVFFASFLIPLTCLTPRVGEALNSDVRTLKEAIEGKSKVPSPPPREKKSRLTPRQALLLATADPSASVSAVDPEPSIALEDGAIQVKFLSAPGLFYRVESSSDLSTWLPLNGVDEEIPGTGALITRTPNFAIGTAKEFYRVRAGLDFFDPPEVQIKQTLSDGRTLTNQSHYTFQNLALGSPPTIQTFTITNMGDRSLNINAVSIGGNFSVFGLSNNETIIGHSAKSFSIVLLNNSAANLGSYSGSLSIATNDPSKPTLNFTVSQSVVTPPPPPIEDPETPPEVNYNFDDPNLEASASALYFVNGGPNWLGLSLNEEYRQTVLVPRNKGDQLYSKISPFDDADLLFGQHFSLSEYTPGEAARARLVAMDGTLVMPWTTLTYIDFLSNGLSGTAMYKLKVSGWPNGWTLDPAAMNLLLAGYHVRIEVQVGNRPLYYVEQTIESCFPLRKGSPTSAEPPLEPIRDFVFTRGINSPKRTAANLIQYAEIMTTLGFDKLEPYKKHKKQFNQWVDLKAIQDDAVHSDIAGQSTCPGHVYSLVSKFNVISEISQEEGMTCGWANAAVGTSWIEDHPQCLTPRTYMHELGHAFGELADEYIVNFDSLLGVGVPWPPVLKQSPNCTQILSTYDSVGGGIPGCSFYSEDQADGRTPFYRPREESIMGKWDNRIFKHNIVGCAAIRARMVYGKGQGLQHWPEFQTECEGLF